ncbi:hypothetical protein ACIBJI_40220 [Nocardia sp. NPDC050408]
MGWSIGFDTNWNRDITWKLTDPSWAQWRQKNPDEVRQLHTVLAQ